MPDCPERLERFGAEPALHAFIRCAESLAVANAHAAQTTERLNVAKLDQQPWTNTKPLSI